MCYHRAMIAVRTICASIAALAFVPVAAGAQIVPPPGVTVVRHVQAGGAQVYSCKQQPDGTYAWTLVGPKAVLVNDDGTDFGTHTTGPRWTAVDGSSIVAEGANPVARLARPNAVPALVLRVAAAGGSGVLSDVRFVVRDDTEGGVAPATGCDAAHAGATVASHYSATYTFYR